MQSITLKNLRNQEFRKKKKKKELTLKNAEELLTERKRINNAFESEIFLMRYTGTINGDDHYIYDGEFYPKEVLTSKTSPPVLLDPPTGRSTEGRGIKILPRHRPTPRKKNAAEIVNTTCTCQ